MASRTLPGGLALTGGRSAGESGWGTEMNANLLRLSTLSQLAVESRVTALPGSPDDGDIYIVPTGAGAEADKVAIRDAGAWTYVSPFAGLLAWVIDETTFCVWNGTAWAEWPAP